MLFFRIMDRFTRTTRSRDAVRNLEFVPFTPPSGQGILEEKVGELCGLWGLANFDRFRPRPTFCRGDVPREAPTDVVPTVVTIDLRALTHAPIQ